MLELRGVEAAYSRSQVLFGIDLTVAAGEVVTLVGRNGMGKTTTVRCIVGLMPLKAGSITFEGRPIDGAPSYRICQTGIGLVPEGRQIFPNLSVRENLICSGVSRDPAETRWTLDRVLAIFPRLGERIDHGGNKLSGGEQQMVAIGRALMTNPKLLIFDEATEGLATARTRANLELHRGPQARAASHLADRQEPRSDVGDRGSALCDREGPCGVERFVERTAGRSDHQPALS